MSASLHALSDDDVGTGGLGELCFADSRHRREPLDASGLHPRHEAVRIEAHNRRYDLWSRLQHCFALSFEIGWRDAAGFRRDLRSPIVEKTPQRFFGDRVSLGRRIGDPQIELKAAVAPCTYVRGPVPDCIRLHQKCPAAPQAASIGDRNGQRSRTGAGHRCHQNRHANIEGFTKGSSAS